MGVRIARIGENDCKNEWRRMPSGSGMGRPLSMD